MEFRVFYWIESEPDTPPWPSRDEHHFFSVAILALTKIELLSTFFLFDVDVKSTMPTFVKLEKNRENINKRRELPDWVTFFVLHWGVVNPNGIPPSGSSLCRCNFVPVFMLNKTYSTIWKENHKISKRKFNIWKN